MPLILTIGDRQVENGVTHPRSLKFCKKNGIWQTKPSAPTWKVFCLQWWGRRFRLPFSNSSQFVTVAAKNGDSRFGSIHGHSNWHRVKEVAA